MRNRIAGLGTTCFSRISSLFGVLPIAAAAVLATGCASTQYVYVPSSNATVNAAGQPGRDYLIPPAAPRGDIEVDSTGLTSLHAKDDPNRDIGAVHVRLVVSNSSDHEWRLNTMAQSIAIAGHGNSAPAFAQADKGTQPPIVTIAPMSKRTIDLFFPLPPDMQDDASIPTFDALWTLDTDAGVISQRTPFHREEVDDEDYHPVGYAAYAWDGPYWINPYYGYYGYYGFYGGVYFGPRYWGHGVYVHRGPYGGFHGGGYHPGGGFHGGGGHVGGGGHGGGHR